MQQPFRRVSVESPFRPRAEPGTEEFGQELREHIGYAKLACIDAVMRGESPMASHLLFTQFLDDTDEIQRVAGLALSHAWRIVADALVFYVDLGWSPGMLDAKALAEAQGIPIEERKLGNIPARVTVPTGKEAELPRLAELCPHCGSYDEESAEASCTGQCSQGETVN